MAEIAMQQQNTTAVGQQPGSAIQTIANVNPTVLPQNVTGPTPDPKAKAFTEKIMELITEAYNLATELATIDDPSLLKHPALQAAQRVVSKVKELRKLISS